MAFQDNSGDIILDVVLTDEGRKRLAQGDGSFDITFFSLGDDEINYQLFDTSKATAQQDLTILQTPVLEAFTNNTASMKSKLFTLSSANANSILYLPIMLLNTLNAGEAFYTGTIATNAYVLCADADTYNNNSNTGLGTTASGERVGVFDGAGTYTTGVGAADATIRVDTGFNTTQTSNLPTDLIENAFIMQMDNRLLQLADTNGTSMSSLYGGIDDDNMRSYLIGGITSGTGTYATATTGTSAAGSMIVPAGYTSTTNNYDSPLNGYLTSYLQFKLRANTQLSQSDFLFNRLGTTDNTTFKVFDDATIATGVKVIDTFVRITGVNYGFSIEIPIKVVKKSA